MLLRELLKIDIVQQAGNSPEILLLRIAQLPGIIAHHALYRQRMQQMERLLIIFSQQLHGLLPWHTLHGIFLPLARQLPPFFSVLSFLV